MVAMHTMELSLFWIHQVDHQMVHAVMSLLTHMMVVLQMNMMECLPEAVLEQWGEASGVVHSPVGSMMQMATHPVMGLQAGEMAQ